MSQPRNQDPPEEVSESSSVNSQADIFTNCLSTFDRHADAHGVPSAPQRGQAQSSFYVSADAGLPSGFDEEYLNEATGIETHDGEEHERLEGMAEGNLHHCRSNACGPGLAPTEGWTKASMTGLISNTRLLDADMYDGGLHQSHPSDSAGPSLSYYGLPAAELGRELPAIAVHSLTRIGKSPVRSMT